MSFWGDIGDRLGTRGILVTCALFAFIGIVARSFWPIAMAAGLLVLVTADTWIWWLPGMKWRRERFAMPLEGGAQRRMRSERPREWLDLSVSYFRGLGFDVDADRVGEIDATATDADYRIVRADASRVWCPEAFTGEEKVYVRLIEEWSRISLGAFQPRDVTEVWEGEFGPVLLEFTHDRERRMVEAHPEDGEIDYSILGPVNDLIEERQFEWATLDARTHFLVCVTPDERRRLATERGWKFR